MGRNAQRRRARRDPLGDLGRLLRRQGADATAGSVTFGWDPENPADRRRVRRISAAAKRAGYSPDLGEDDAPQ